MNFLVLLVVEVMLMCCERGRTKWSGAEPVTMSSSAGSSELQIIPVISVIEMKEDIPAHVNKMQRMHLE